MCIRDRVRLSRLRLTQVELYAVDLLVDRVTAAHAGARAHNIGAHFAAADACRLPFPDGAFDSVFCVAVLQHIGDVDAAVGEMARVTRPGGRIVAVEPDNSSRFFFSSIDEGRQAYAAAARFFSALAESRGDTTDPAVGSRLAALLPQHGVEPIGVHLFPVSGARLGVPPRDVWEARRAAVAAQIDGAPDEAIRRLGQDYLKALDRYAAAASAAGRSFVEIQNTLLFGTVGQRTE